MLMTIPVGRIVTTHRACDYHKRNPHERDYPGCTCSGAYVFTTSEESEDGSIQTAKEWAERRVDLPGV